jgi:hypothetical protein
MRDARARRANSPIFIEYLSRSLRAAHYELLLSHNLLNEQNTGAVVDVPAPSGFAPVRQYRWSGGLGDANNNFDCALIRLDINGALACYFRQAVNS